MRYSICAASSPQRLFAHPPTDRAGRSEHSAGDSGPDNSGAGGLLVAANCLASISGDVLHQSDEPRDGGGDILYARKLLCVAAEQCQGVVAPDPSSAETQQPAGALERVSAPPKQAKRSRRGRRKNLPLAGGWRQTLLPFADDA